MAPSPAATRTLQPAVPLPARGGPDTGQPLDAARRPAGAWSRQLILNGWRLLPAVVLLGIWEIAATTVTTPFWISQPSRVAVRLGSLTMSGLLFWHVWATLQAALLGLALGGIVGVALGLLL